MELNVTHIEPALIEQNREKKPVFILTTQAVLTETEFKAFTEYIKGGSVNVELQKK